VSGALTFSLRVGVGGAVGSEVGAGSRDRVRRLGLLRWERIPTV